MTPEQQHQWNLEIFRSLAETGKAAQTALLTIVGGSAAALLSFVGVLADKPDRQGLVMALMQALGWIAWSLLAVLVMSGLAYVAQGLYKRATYERSDLFDTADEGARATIRKKADRVEKWGDFVSVGVMICFAAAVALWLWGTSLAISAGQEAARQRPPTVSPDNG